MKKIDVNELRPNYEYRFHMKSGIRLLGTVTRTDETCVYLTDGGQIGVKARDWVDDEEIALVKADIDTVFDEGGIFNEYVAYVFRQKHQ